MKHYTLTVIDTKGIQKYIFGTNSLRQIVGASYLVDCATRYWLVDCLTAPHNVMDIEAVDPDKRMNGQKIEDGELSAELIYCGGGNAVVLFARREDAVKFARRLTRKVLLQAPGLDISLVHKDFDWDAEQLKDVLKDAEMLLAERKVSQLASTPMLGLGVTADCVFTGLPAVAFDPYERERYERKRWVWIGAEAEAKIVAGEKAHRRLLKLLSSSLKDYDVPKDFDEFGRAKGESSYIAIAHTDGNQMGNRIKAFIDQHSSDNRSLIEAQRDISLSIEKTTMEVLKETTDLLVHSVATDEEGRKKIADLIELYENKIPFRPIVFGGDDLTFVCDGRLGLTLTALYLKKLSGRRLADQKPVHCRAGVAVVKTRFPFARGYALAEELCASAKKRIVELKERGEDDVSVMDWHFAAGGLMKNLKDIRNQEFTVGEGTRLYMRPVSLTGNMKDWRSWDNFERVVQKFKWEPWRNRRNKVKALWEVLRTSSGEAVEHFLKVYGLPRLPDIPEMPEMGKRGFQGGWCGYFDAIEAMDFYIPLEGGIVK